MCVSPITIRNYWYGSDMPLKNTWDTHIDVPCGHCSQCISRKQTDILQRVQLESLNSYVYNFTLTYNDDCVPKLLLPETKVMVNRLYYKHITDMFKRIRTTGYFGLRKFKYLVCGEYGKVHSRPHYHGLLFLEKLPSDSKFEFMNLEKLAYDTILFEWRENIATTVAKRTTKRYHAGTIIKNTRNPVWRPLCTYKRVFVHGQVKYTYDLHYVTPMASNGNNDVSYYVTKYLFKDADHTKYIKRLCYDEAEVNADIEDAMKFYRDWFRSGCRKSQNFCSLYTNDSYKAFRSTHDRHELKYNDVVRDKILSDAVISESQDSPLKFYDVYTGQPLPMSQYLVDRLPNKLQVYHAKKKLLYQLEHGSRIPDRGDVEQDVIRMNHRERVIISDIFDDTSFS